jgi:hypothetical protein
MSHLLHALRSATPTERAEALAVLVGDALQGRCGPVAVQNAAAHTVGYLTPELSAAATLPLPAFTDEELAELRRRAANPQEGIPVEEFILRFDAATAEGKPR